MARKVTITKELILQNALELLIEDGYQSISIHSLAKKTGCSTQPIAWHFENMEGLRKALYVYAAEYEASKTDVSSLNGSPAFRKMGETYINTAIKEPNLFKFLYLGEGPVSKPYSLADIPMGKVDENMIKRIAKETGLTEEAAAVVVQDTVFYSHGIASLIATGVLKTTLEEAVSMIVSASEGFVIKERTFNEKK